MTDDKQKDQQPGFGSIVMSTLAAAFGVQSSKNRERDFVKGNFKAYVVSGIIFVILLLPASSRW
ncbi:MAG: DUF2970 domain-containing protein [Cellvibrionales bacterium]|nr:DUF2970 domain-containing protein [Cellvibrionales bacterium]